MTLPWVVVGNFNIVLFENENSSGVPVNNQASTQMLNYLNLCNIQDICFSGPPYTQSKGTLRERIVWVVANSPWKEAFLNSSIKHLGLLAFDHCGLWVNVKDGNSKFSPASFEFLGRWLDHLDFNVQVEKSLIINDDQGN